MTWHSVPRVLLLSILCVIALANFLGVRHVQSHRTLRSEGSCDG